MEIKKLIIRRIPIQGLLTNHEINYVNIDCLTEYMSEDVDLADKIIDSFNQLYQKDTSLINRNCCDESNISGQHVGERSIVFRYAHYLLNNIDSDTRYSSYDLDCEYNRNGNGLKTIADFSNGKYPDLIIHKRETNDNNLLIMEFKTWWNSQRVDILSDIIKIAQFMNKSDIYKFKYGMSIILNKDSVTINCVEPR